jgi:hypothetical protein
MNRKLIFAFLASCSLVFATDIDSKIEDISARKGIEIGGTVRSASYSSFFESPQEKPNVNGYYLNKLPSREIIEFVQLDLDFRFRPYDIIGANLKLRLGAGAQEYFATASTTVNVPWLNIEGNYNENFYWVVGDFRQAWSPLTLYMPGLDIMYEPVAFARKREMAQKDALLNGSQRNLQGFNLQFRPQLGGVLGELRVEALGARLRRAGYLDASGAMGNILPNEGIPGATQAGRFDKFLFGGNVELLPLNKNVLVGGTYLAVADDKSTFKYYECPDAPNSNCRLLNSYSKEYLLNTLDSLPQKTFVFAGRAGADIAGILGMNSIIANATGEFAQSKDKVYNEIYDENNEFIGNASRDETGNAILAQMDLGYKGIVDVVLSSSFIRNDSSWFNNAAQSPSFFARRVLNSDKDIGCGTNIFTSIQVQDCIDHSNNISKYGVYSPLYSTFDALYFFTPKFSPMDASLTAGEPRINAQNESYNSSPYAKTSWSSATLTRAELALLEILSDQNLQMALPNGFATSNRQGYQEILTVNWQGLAEAKGLFANYEQLSDNLSAKAAKYTEYGGGAKVDVLGILGFEKNPLEISGSYKHSAKEQEWNNWGIAEFKSDFINAGLYYRFFRRFGLTLGYQQINSDLNAIGADIQKAQAGHLKIDIVPVLKSKQDQWMAGIDYTVSRNAWLSINYGIIGVENTYILDEGQFGVESNMPGYIVANMSPAQTGKTEIKHEFTRNILEATINVEF